MEPPTSSAAALRREAVIPVLPTPNALAMEEKPTLRQVFDAEESALLRFAHSLTGQRETAEDLVQDAFLKLHTHWHEVQQPRPWLFRCVRNLALNHLRDNRRNHPSKPTARTPRNGKPPPPTPTPPSRKWSRVAGSRPA